MAAHLHYAFIDESGTVGVSRGTHFLVVAVLTTDQPRSLELPVRRALRKYGRSLKQGELKAARTSEDANLKLLKAIAKSDIRVIAIIVDQGNMPQPPDDGEDIYRQAVREAVIEAVKLHPVLEICLDQRYTHELRRHALEKSIREGLTDLHPQMVLIRQQSSQVRKELQAADVVAWAFFQKYERNDLRYYEVIADKIVVEKLY